MAQDATDPVAPGPAATLPRGRHAAPREIVLASQRRRMLEGMASAVAEKGYGAVVVADVIERGGVSRKTFYEHFANKEECFLDAYDFAVELLLDGIDGALRESHPEPLSAAVAGTRSYLEALAAHPDLARTFLVEISGAGDRAMARRSAVHVRFALQLERSYEEFRKALPELPALPPEHYRACVGAVNELVTQQLIDHGPASLPTLLDSIMRIELSLLLGFPGANALLKRATGD
jgi:AcrR family transcriptional regulator